MKKNIDTTVYEEKIEHHDNLTGEVTEKINRKVVRKEKTPEFVMLFVDGVDIYTNAKLSKAQGQVMSQLLKYTIKNSNMLMMHKKVKEMIAKDAGLKQDTVNSYLKILVKKNLVIRDDGLLFLNPDIFGKGDFNEVKKLRHTLQIDYDFEALEATTITKTAVEYYNDEPLEIINAHEKIEDNKIEQTIVTQAIKQTKPKLKTIDDLFNARIFTSFDDDINNATQNDEIRDLAYRDLEGA